MKVFILVFILWIVLQLMLIGSTTVKMNNDLVDNKYDCSIVTLPRWIGIAVPLAVFAPEDRHITEYCAKAKLKRGEE